jgi:mannose-6-phosphate isomerase
MTHPYILKMSPYLRPKIWGGRKLADVFGKALPEAGPYGESWEVSDLPEGQSAVLNGPLAGRSLGEMVELWGRALTGADAAEGAAFPLLVKVLDASDDLSVQVHPGDDDIERLGLDADSKDECWIILDSDADPDAGANSDEQEHGCILHGFSKATTPGDFRMAVQENRAADVLRRLAVQPGDVVRVSPGTIHAICKGVALLEIQQPSDTTYRVYDYQRPGMDGKPRELHLEEAMRVSKFAEHPPARLTPQPSSAHPDVTVLVDVPAYRIERASGITELRWTVDARTPQVVFAANSAGLTLFDGTETVELAYAETAIIPAGIGHVRLSSEGRADVVVAGLGGAPLVGA